MTGAASTFTRHPAAPRYRWFVLLIAVAALVAPARHVALSTATARHHHGTSDRAHAGDVPTSAVAEAASAKSEVHERRGTSGGTLPAGILAILGALALWSVRRSRQISVRPPHVAFRRRGPPLRQLAY